MCASTDDGVKSETVLVGEWLWERLVAIVCGISEVRCWEHALSFLRPRSDQLPNVGKVRLLISAFCTESADTMFVSDRRRISCWHLADWGSA